MRQAVPYLRLIAARATTLANELESGRYYNSDVRRGLQEITDAMQRVQSETRSMSPHD